jgi:signal peptidase I
MEIKCIYIVNGLLCGSTCYGSVKALAMAWAKALAMALVVALVVHLFFVFNSKVQYTT